MPSAARFVETVDYDGAVHAPRVIVGVDGSAESMAALEWAAGEARLRNDALLVVHAAFARSEFLRLYPDLLLVEHQVLDAAVRRARALAPDIVVKGAFYDPPVAAALTSLSDGADLLVVGSRGLGRSKALTVGSVSEECARHARCPVAIVRAAPSRADFSHTACRAGGSPRD